VIELVTTDGIFRLDGGECDVENNIWLFGDDREVLVIDVHDKPGTLGELARELAEASVNIDLAYAAYGGVRLVIATDDLDNARAALE